MSDVMFYGVLRMPYEMAMESELSRRQFHGRVKEAVDRVERAEAEVLDLHRQLAAERLRADQGWARYEEANADRNALREERAHDRREQVGPLVGAGDGETRLVPYPPPVGRRKILMHDGRVLDVTPPVQKSTPTETP